MQSARDRGDAEYAMSTAALAFLANISDNRQIVSVREFMASLPDVLGSGS